VDLSYLNAAACLVVMAIETFVDQRIVAVADEMGDLVLAIWLLMRKAMLWVLSLSFEASS